MTRYGPGLVLEGRDRADRHHRAAVRARLQLGDVARVVAVRGVGLSGHAIGAAEQVEVVDVGRSEIDLQRLEHALRRNAEHVGLGAVDVRPDPRRRRVVEREDVGERRVLVRRADQLAGRLLQRLVAHVAAVLDDHAIAAAVADALDDGRRDDEGERLVHVRQRGAHVVLDILLGAVGPGALLERLEGDIGRAGVGRLRSRGAVEAGEHDRFVDARNLAGSSPRLSSAPRRCARSSFRAEAGSRPAHSPGPARGRSPPECSPEDADGQRDQPGIDRPARASAHGGSGG